MKIALQFSGQPRAFKEGYEYYKKNLLGSYDVDVFCNFWNCTDAWDVITLYNAKRFDIVHPLFTPELYNERYPRTPNPKQFPPYNTISAFCSLFHCNILRLQEELKGAKYDFVIKSRTDFALNGKLPFEQMKKDKLYVPDDRMLDVRNDQFAVGSPEIMTDYCSTYLHLNDFYEKGVSFIGEDMLMANLRKHGLVEKLEHLNMNHPFIDGPYNVGRHSLIRSDMKKWNSA